MGNLRYPGTNHTVDIAVVREAEREEWVLLIMRRDGTWALPGGFRDPGETASDAAKRELKEETNIDVEVKDIALLYQGHVYDPRQRLDRTISTSLFGFFLDMDEDVPVRAGDDAQAAQWVPLTIEGLADFLKSTQGKLYADHMFLLHRVLDSRITGRLPLGIVPTGRITENWKLEERPDGVDQFRFLAAALFKIPMEEVTEDQRRKAKMAAYHHVYAGDIDYSEIEKRVYNMIAGSNEPKDREALVGLSYYRRALNVEDDGEETIYPDLRKEPES